MLAVADQEQEYWQRVEVLRRLEHIIAATSLTAVAERLQVSKATIYRWMWGQRRPSFENLQQIAAAYPTKFPELSILKEEP